MTGTLICSVAKLPHLHLRIKALPKALRLKLLDARSGWLQTVILSVSDSRTESLSSANKVLASCPQLEKFSLGLWSRSSSRLRRVQPKKTWPAIVFWALCRQPWSCPGLASNDFADPSELYWATYGDKFLETLARQGWAMVQKTSPDLQTAPPHPFPNLVVVEKVLPQVAKTKLRIFEENYVKYVKIGASL